MRGRRQLERNAPRGAKAKRTPCSGPDEPEPSGCYGLTVGLWLTIERGVLGGGWFSANPIHVPRCPPTQGTPFIVGTPQPETTVGTPPPEESASEEVFAHP
jgi:hypothetical protein